MRLLLGVFSLLLMTLSLTSHAQPYPSRPIKIVIGFPPGGGAELPVRAIQLSLQEQLGQPIVIDSKPGAGGVIAAAYVAKSTPDGYTLLLASTTLAVMPSRKTKPSFDPLNDFTGVAGIGSGAYSLVVNPSLPVDNVADLVAYAKANPGKLSAAVSSLGGTDFLVFEYFKLLTGTNIITIPYKGTADVDRALLAGEVMVGMGGVSTVPLIRAGKVKALAVTNPKRLQSLPTLPAIAETLPGFDGSFWLGLHAPRGTPPAAISAVNQAVINALQRPDVRERFSSLNLEPWGLSSSDFEAHYRKDIARWADLVKRSGLELE